MNGKVIDTKNKDEAKDGLKTKSKVLAGRKSLIGKELHSELNKVIEKDYLNKSSGAETKETAQDGSIGGNDFNNDKDVKMEDDKKLEKAKDNTSTKYEDKSVNKIGGKSSLL